MEDTRDILLFSYGTLQLESVQRSSFGRRLEGESDAMTGYTQTLVEIFRISTEELAAADRYEVADYRRVRVRLASGRDAWAYVKV
jgi:hypothetical protein